MPPPADISEAYQVLDAPAIGRLHDTETQRSFPGEVASLAPKTRCCGRQRSQEEERQALECFHWHSGSFAVHAW